MVSCIFINYTMGVSRSANPTLASLIQRTQASGVPWPPQPTKFILPTIRMGWLHFSQATLIPFGIRQMRNAPYRYFKNRKVVLINLIDSQSKVHMIGTAGLCQYEYRYFIQDLRMYKLHLTSARLLLYGGVNAP